jgi:hypothetical protein
LRECPPNDIDVVTFFYLPDGMDERTFYEQNKWIFDNCMKQKFKTDHYFVCLEAPLNEENHELLLIQQVGYWYSLWSHQRSTLRWKGFFQIQ